MCPLVALESPSAFPLCEQGNESVERFAQMRNGFLRKEKNGEMADELGPNDRLIWVNNRYCSRGFSGITLFSTSIFRKKRPQRISTLPSREGTLIRYGNSSGLSNANKLTKDYHTLHEDTLITQASAREKSRLCFFVFAIFSSHIFHQKLNSTLPLCRKIAPITGVRCLGQSR